MNAESQNNLEVQLDRIFFTLQPEIISSILISPPLPDIDNKNNVDQIIEQYDSNYQYIILLTDSKSINQLYYYQLYLHICNNISSVNNTSITLDTVRLQSYLYNNIHSNFPTSNLSNSSNLSNDYYSHICNNISSVRNDSKESIIEEVTEVFNNDIYSSFPTFLKPYEFIYIPNKVERLLERYVSVKDLKDIDKDIDVAKEYIYATPHSLDH